MEGICFQRQGPPAIRGCLISFNMQYGAWAAYRRDLSDVHGRRTALNRSRTRVETDVLVVQNTR